MIHTLTSGLMRHASLPVLLSLPLLNPLAAAAATVISIGDGDTLRVEDRGRPVTVRVACIDAPEMAQAPHGQKAREALQSMLPVGSTVRLKVQTTDRHGRTVAEVFTEGGRNVGLALVQQGHAYAYRRYLRQCDARSYLGREQRAQRHRSGIWTSDGGIERPWDFRAGRRHLPSPAGPRVSAAVRRWRCREVASWEHAQQLLLQGHTDLDGDGDGEACEALR